MQMMPLRLFAPYAVAIALISEPGTACAEDAGTPQSELPSGAGATFRSRMMEWSAEAETPPAPPALPAANVVQKAPRPRGQFHLSSHYGYRIDPIDGSRRLHAGIDIPGPAGSPVYSAATGRVSFSGRRGAYGEMIEIDHGNGMSTRYAHLSRSLVQPGTIVAQGERIALMGSTGRSTGNHLHFEVRKGGLPLDPIGFLDSPGEDGGYRRILPAAAPLERHEPHRSAFAQAREAETDN
ncbi:MAG TPA: M23 family metallopeptidase [Sphingomonadaceae bacterium]|nr:M23 family metallopeptidase [Sphingomonadaceae bacterium]